MTTALLGIDVSSHQGDIDFAQVREAGFRFCIVKASEGADYQDGHFVTNLQRIRDLGAGAGFFPGAYHLGHPDHRAGRSGGETEAKWFCKVLTGTAKQLGLSLTQGFLEPVLDMEIYDESDASDNLAWVQGFLAVVAAETGRKGMVYTGVNYWRYQAGDSDALATAGIPLWEVKYQKDGDDPAQSPPRIPSDARKSQWAASLWQWSGGGDYAYYHAQHGAIPGIAGGIADVSRVMGDETVLARLAASSTAGTTTPTVTAQTTDSSPPLPAFDLRDRRGRTSTTVARVQGLLLSQGQGPAGLVSRTTGRPDGIDGSATEAALAAFKASVGLRSDTVLDEQTWSMLVRHGLD
jgi:GH25 family lysozyme M1 (1,4-beta-N-acetylmuramidase)